MCCFSDLEIRQDFFELQREIKGSNEAVQSEPKAVDDEILFDDKSKSSCDKLGSTVVAAKPNRRSFRSQGNLFRLEQLQNIELTKQADVLSEVCKTIAIA